MSAGKFDKLMLRLIDYAVRMNDDVSYSDFEGCKDDDIIEVMKKYHVSALPESYVGFLRAMGKKARPLTNGMTITYPGILELGDDVKAYTQGDINPLVLSEGDFVFADYLNDPWFYFNLNEGPDPPVYMYVTESKPEKYSESFVGFLLKEFSYVFKGFKINDKFCE